MVVLEDWLEKDRTPCERFYTAEDREVLYRRCFGPNASRSRIYDYEKLPTEPNVVIEDEEYHLWYDTILVGREEDSILLGVYTCWVYPQLHHFLTSRNPSMIS